MDGTLGAPKGLIGLQGRSAGQQPEAPPSNQITPSDDDDDFVEPPPRAPLLEKTVNIIRNEPTTAKLPMKPNKCIRPPTVRCAPAIFNSFVDHLTMNQRRKITGMGFGGLLQISAEGLESRDLLQFLMDRLNPMNMEIDLGKERTLQITPLVVEKVLGLPLGGGDIHAPTKTQSSQALIKFRELICAEPNQPIKSDYLQKLLQAEMFEDDMAVKLFFIVAFNKLLFPDTSNYIRGKDIFATQDISEFPDLDWCTAVVDNLRDACLSWHENRGKEGNKSISGCSILMIIFYLDNLSCQCQINHTHTPRAKFFNKAVIEEIMKADRTKDKDGKVTFGKLLLRNRDATCYYSNGANIPQVPLVAADPVANYTFPSIQAELGVLAARLAGTTRKREVSRALAAFDSETENALNYINKGQFMLLEAHHKVIHNLKQTLEIEVHGNISEDTDERPMTRQKNSHNAAKSTHDGHVHAANGHAQPARAPELPDPSQQPKKFEGKSINNNTQNKDVEFVVAATGITEPAHVAELPDLIQQPQRMEGKPLSSNSHNEVAHVDFVVPHNAHAQHVRDGELIAHTQLPEPMEYTSLNSDSHIEENCTQEDPASLVDVIIDMIDATVDRDLETANPPQPLQTSQPELDGGFAYGQENSAEISPEPVPTDHAYDQKDMEGPGSNDVAVNAIQAQGSNNTSDEQLGPVLMRLCTQEEKLLQPPTTAPCKRITKVPSKYISPFKGFLGCPKVPSTKAFAVRKKFSKSLKSSRDYFITIGSSVYNGKDIFESFGDDDAPLSSRFMSTIVRCMRHDEESNMPDGGGYRVFLPQELVEMINIDEHEEGLEWPVEAAESLMERSLTTLAPHKVKLYFLPVLENDEWSVYCINMIHRRIDVLDSSAADHGVYHEVLGDRIIPRLNALFQQVTNGGVKDFAKWRRPIRHIAEQAFENDSGFFAARFMQLWDGDALTTPVIPEKIPQIKAELLYYLLYHPINEKKKLPAGLEAFRPRP